MAGVGHALKETDRNEVKDGEWNELVKGIFSLHKIGSSCLRIPVRVCKHSEKLDFWFLLSTLLTTHRLLGF